MLIHTISVEFQPTMEVNVHNQCSDFELTGRGYFSNGVSWDEDSYEEIDTSSMKRIDFMLSLAVFEGALTYVLERKHVKTSTRPEPTRILLLLAWKSKCYRNFRVFVHLIEYDKAFYWDELNPEEYYQRYASQFSTYTGPIKDTWLIPDGAVLSTELELDFTKRDGVLSVTISKGVEDKHTKRPEWLDLERWVLLESKDILMMHTNVYC
jgi:hypothetical protein